MKHWLPYKETTMLRLLGIDRAELSTSGKRTLWQLARSRGLDPDRVLRRLVRPWRHHAAAKRRLMLHRARRTFTQQHLAVHMFSHPFHIAGLDSQWPRIFGVSVAETYREMYAGHLSYLGVGARHRGSADLVRRDFRHFLRNVAREGVRRHEVLRGDAREALAADFRKMVSWLSYTPTALSAGSPVAANSTSTAVSSLHCRLSDGT